MPRLKEPVRTQSMLFTIFGDYVYMRNRGGEIWTGSLIKLVGQLGFSEQAVRLALSRMCRKGWLNRVKVGTRSFYSLSQQSLRLMQESEKRIYPAHHQQHWDGFWHVVTLVPAGLRRGAVDKLRKELTWLGYGALSPSTWFSPYDHSAEVRRLAAETRAEGLIEVFEARYRGFGQEQEFAARCWNLAKSNAQYRQFLDRYEPACRSFQKNLLQGTVADSECFVERVQLVHDYRKFPFSDPGLPRELLPADWLGEKSAALFEEFGNLLQYRAYAFFDSVNQTRFSLSQSCNPEGVKKENVE